MMEVNFTPETLKKLEKLGGLGKDVRMFTLQRAATEAMGGAKEMAPYHTGNLRRSITMDPQRVTGTTEAVKVGSNLIYARIQDLGGTITPKKAKMLRFQVKGEWVMAYAVKIKGNRYLTTQLEKMKSGRLDSIFKEEFERAAK